MAKLCTGIDIGASAVKLAVCRDGGLRGAASAAMPENLLAESTVNSPASLADFLKVTAKEGRIRRDDCALCLPAGAAFFRRTTMPVMTEENLKINLPFEFRDFITEDKEKFVFDYSVVQLIKDENGEVKSMDIMAAAARRETIETYRDILRAAGFRLVRAVPEEIAYSDLIRRYEATAAVEEKREYCILDLGHTATRLHFYTGSAHEATRVIDYGGRLLDTAIAESFNVDVHIAAAYKLENYQDALSSEPCMRLYANLAIELMQALNFYNYNYPDNDLQTIYLCGGGARIAPLLEAIRGQVTLEFKSIAELMPPGTPEEIAAEAGLYPLAYAATLMQEVKAK